MQDGTELKPGTRPLLLRRPVCHSLASAAQELLPRTWITVMTYHLRTASTPRIWAAMGVVCLFASQIDAGGTTRKRGRRT
jgi:hypothetical protein